MNRPLAQCIVNSLRVDGPSEEHVTRLGNFTERDWQRTLSWLDDSGLALYLLGRVNASGSAGLLPAVIQARLARNLESNQQRLAAMREEFYLLNRRFDAAGVEYAVLKGFALIPDFCPSAELRCQYDYDYLVSRKSVDIAKQALQSAGYSQKVKSPGFEHKDESIFAAQPLRVPQPGENFYSPSLPRLVELHLSLWESDRDMINLELPGEVLERKRLTKWDGLCFPTLSDSDALVFQALHTFQHILSYWCRVSCFLEIARFIAQRRSDGAFWERFSQRVDLYKHLPAIVSLVLSISATLFDAPLGGGVRTWMKRRLPNPLSLWVERYLSDWALASYPGSKLSLFVHREFVQDRRVWRRILWSRLLPFHRPASVVEAGGPGEASKWKGKIHSWRFDWFRLKFHFSTLVGYGWQWPRWRRVLQNLR